MTNGDKIRQMSDEELAQFLILDFDNLFPDKICLNFPDCKFEDKCEECILEWLCKESDNNDK